jgi:hypothetical protein
MKFIFEYGPTIIRWLFIALGGFTVVMLFIGAIRGIIPVLWRLGKSLYNRKIALYAEGEATSLRSTLIDSNLFKKKNIDLIGSKELAKGRDHSMMIVYYPEFKNYILDIISLKNDSDSLIVYAPSSGGRIDNEILDAINAQRNSIIVNMRGRLLNDILTSMITTNYAKK